MGWFSKVTAGRREKETPDIAKDTEEFPGTAPEVKKISNGITKKERLALVQENCEQITENLRQMEEAKAEYQAVTSYLLDMQKIDLIPREQRENLEDAARRILNLNKEREKFREKNTSITDGQYRLFERYEIQLPREIEAIKESERYQAVIQKDLDQLEKEKQKLLAEEDEIIKKHSFLKGIAITTFIIVVLLFGIFAALARVTGANLILPFLLTVLMGMISALYIFMEARRNLYDIKVVELKQKRQVVLTNKVKLKSVNNRNYLEYTYNKYMVNNCDELKTCWEEYVKIKDETSRYKNNTELL